jgi:organic radical activating enzyme
LLVGCRQIFVRMAGCNLDCAYCDTPFQATEFCRVEDAPSSGLFRPLHNPVSLDTLLNLLSDWNRRLPGLHHSIALTGGEPLLQASLLGEWLPSLRELLPIYLETNGTMPAALEPLLPRLDWISMDLKLPSVSGSPTPWQDHCNFLALAREKECQVKVVVGGETSVREVSAAARMVQEVAPQVPLVLQPVTREGRIGLSSDHLIALHTAAARIHPTTRIIPQTHRFLGLP